MYFPTAIVQYIALNGLNNNWLEVSSKSLQFPMSKKVVDVKKRKSVNVNGFIVPQFVGDRFLFFQKSCFEKKGQCGFQYINQQKEILGDIKLDKFRHQEILSYYPNDKFFQLPVVKKIIERKIEEQKTSSYLINCNLQKYKDKSILKISEFKSFVFDLFCIKVRADLLGQREAEVYEGSDYIKMTSFNKEDNSFEVIVVLDGQVNSFSINYKNVEKEIVQEMISEVRYEPEDNIARETRYIELSVKEKSSPVNMIYAYNAYSGDSVKLKEHLINLLSKNRKKNKKILHEIFFSEGAVFKEEGMVKMKKTEDEVGKTNEDTKWSEDKLIEDSRVFGH